MQKNTHSLFDRQKRIFIHYGMDLTSMTARKKTLFPEESQKERSTQTLMDRTAEVVASALKAEFCRIFRLYHGCIGLQENQLSVQEIGFVGQPDKLEEFDGGSVFL